MPSSLDLSNLPDADVVAVAIAPDLGESYLDSVYNYDWVRKLP